MTEFLTQQAQTLNFTLGRPGQFQVSADGRQVLFCRTMDGTSNLAALWVYDVEPRHRTAAAPAGCRPVQRVGRGPGPAGTAA